MIAVDTSALMAIFLREDGADRLIDRLAAEPSSIISAGNMLELQLVAMRVDRDGVWSDVERLISANRIEIRPFDARQLAIAREAAERFGRGRHKARLNIGDCFAYALAKSENVPLLCVGNDFAETDIALA